jgi:hypothetical protein
MIFANEASLPPLALIKIICAKGWQFRDGWRRLPDDAYKHAATEVSRCSEASISAEDYASGAAFFLTALRKHGWVVSPPTVLDPMLDMPSQDA